MFDLSIRRKFDWKLEGNGLDEDRTTAAMSRWDLNDMLMKLHKTYIRS